MNDAVRIGFLPDDVARLVEVLAAKLDVVRTTGEVVLEEAERARVLVAATLVQPITATALDDVGCEIFVARRGGVADQAEVVAELSGADFGEHVLADRAVPFALIDPAWRILQQRRISGRVNGLVADPVAVVGAVRLLLGPVLQVADELVVLVHLIGRLAGVVEQLGVERRAVQERPGRGRADRVLLIQVGEVAPDAIAHDRAADAEVEVLVGRQPVAILANRPSIALRGRRANRERLLLGEVARLNVAVLVVVIEVDAELIAAALADELRDDARVWHLGGVRRRADEHLFERAVVEIEAGGSRAFRRVDALDERTILAGVAVGEVRRLRAGGAAADVDAVERHRRRRGQQRPHVARVRDRRERLLVVVGLHARRRRIDNRRFTAHRDRLLHARDTHRDVDLGVEAQRDTDAFANDALETSELEGQPVLARRDGREAIDTRFVGDGRERADLCRARRSDGHAGQHAALRVLDFTTDAPGGARAAALGERGGRGQAHDGGQGPNDVAPTFHARTS